MLWAKTPLSEKIEFVAKFLIGTSVVGLWCWGEEPNSILLVHEERLTQQVGKVLLGSKHGSHEPHPLLQVKHGGVVPKSNLPAHRPPSPPRI
jgi:hypothetical protein